MKDDVLRTIIWAFSLISTGCATTQVQWDSIKMREQIMDYYNDEIMDNLIRVQEGLPVVHVDISLVTAIVGSKLSGALGGGETRAHTTSLVGVISSIAQTVTRPFTWSVTPERSDSLTVTAAPVLGKVEFYKLYHDFIFGKENDKIKPKGTLASSESRPPDFVPGTLKKHGNKYYFIPKGHQAEYVCLCNNLLFVARRPVTFDLDAIRAEIERVQGLQILKGD